MPSSRACVLDQTIAPRKKSCRAFSERPRRSQGGPTRVRGSRPAVHAGRADAPHLLLGQPRYHRSQQFTATLLVDQVRLLDTQMRACDKHMPMSFLDGKACPEFLPFRSTELSEDVHSLLPCFGGGFDVLGDVQGVADTAMSAGLTIWMADGDGQRQGLIVVIEGFGRDAHGTRRLPETVDRGDLRDGVTDLADQGQGLLVAVLGLAMALQPQMEVAKFDQRARLVRRAARLATEGEGLLVNEGLGPLDGVPASRRRRRSAASGLPRRSPRPDRADGCSGSARRPSSPPR